ncbi:hypothetical protein LVW15_24385, partial [Klebsiella pneumoniae]|nr:hypothetical protein [Klebsiella pneumoniae]
PEAAFCPTKSLGLEWMNSNPRMQIADFFHSLMGNVHRRNVGDEQGFCISGNYLKWQNIQHINSF